MSGPERAAARTVRRAVALYGAGLAVVWGLILPAFLLLDPIAAGWARLTGCVAALTSTAAAYGVTRLRLRRRAVPHFAFRAALDLAVAVSIAAILAWQIHQLGGRVPYVEAFSILLFEIATGWAAALGLYVGARARLRTLPGSAALRGLPGVRTVCVAGALVLGVFASVSLSIGSSGRAAGALDRQAAWHLDHLADLVATAVGAARDDDGRRRALGATEILLHTRALLQTGDRLPAALAAAGVAPRWASPDPSADGRLIALHDGVRYHWARRSTPAGVVWTYTAANVRPPVRAPDDAPAMLILALLVLGAPAAAWAVGQDVRAELGQVTADLQAMAPGDGGTGPAGVPVASNDEVGDLAVALNALVHRFSTQNSALADALDAAHVSDRARARFLAAASHELRIPLHTISGYCHLLQSSGRLNPAQSEDVRVIEDAAAELLGHVDEILDLGRIEAGRDEPLILDTVDLPGLVTRILARATPPPLLTVKIQTAADLPRIRADGRRIQQIIENLVGNACKFTPAGEVVVELSPATLDGAPAARICVRDTGPGIPQDELEAVFIDFHRVEGQRSVAGTGLGLPIARRLAQRHGGRLWAESSLGVGSRFTLILPVAGPPGEGPA